MHLVLLGPPGAGKGTLSEKARDLLKVPQISTGALFRAAIAEGSPLGHKVKGIIGSGKLVDDETTIGLIKSRLAEDDVKNGYILDGYPRTIAQAEALEKISHIEKVVNLIIPDEWVLERLGGRRVCRDCGHSFHIVYDIPKIENVCDHCGGEIYTRDDDKAEAIQKRQEVYKAQTAPLICFYRKLGVVVDVHTCLEYEDTLANFKKALGL